MTETKDAVVNIRLTADEKAQLEAKAKAEDVSVSQLGRRGIKAVLAGTAVLVAALTLTACGGTDEPSTQPTTMSIDEARATVAAQHSAELEAEATALAKGCTQTGPGSEFDQRWRSQPTSLEATDEEMATQADAFIAWIDEQPEGCTDADVAWMAEVRKGAVMIAELDD